MNADERGWMWGTIGSFGFEFEFECPSLKGEGVYIFTVGDWDDTFAGIYGGNSAECLGVVLELSHEITLP